MSSNPILDDDDVLLIPPAEEADDNDTAAASSSISRGAVGPYWTENPTHLPYVPASLHGVFHGMEMQQARQQRLSAAVQVPQGSTVLPPISAPPPVSFVGAYVASCFVYWCFCLVLGGVAYVVAVIGENHAYEGNIEKAKAFRRASFISSGIGVLLGIVLLIVMLTVFMHPGGH